MPQQWVLHRFLLLLTLMLMLWLMLLLLLMRAAGEGEWSSMPLRLAIYAHCAAFWRHDPTVNSHKIHSKLALQQ